ncbi:MAG TPA: MerR family DNA-binding transcriptional regulator [Solirubrobacteraceae bacterium]|jgi:DNA-binding transcriptional MerR regulator|nr:MerR family DNA-binding transcriptional regulator [Solirubrobacteraceae bacterium]
MTGIRTNAAATMLGVSPNTLRSWERRYGFPKPHRSAGNHRQFSLAQIEALKHTLAETHNVSSAISLARSRGEGPSSPSRLATAFSMFDDDRADRLLDESLALRSVERTVEEVLLPALAAQLVDSEPTTPEYQFAWRHATGWLSALKRLAPPASRPHSVLVFDATAPCDFDAVHAQALELLLRRAGMRTLSLTPALDPSRLGRALRALGPTAVVLTGRRTSLETIGKLVYAVRGVAQAALVCDYRGAVPDTGASTVCRLGDEVIAARDRLIERLDAPAVRPGAGREEPSVRRGAGREEPSVRHGASREEPSVRRGAGREEPAVRTSASEAPPPRAARSA